MIEYFIDHLEFCEEDILLILRLYLVLQLGFYFGVCRRPVVGCW
jgi:hypothetical protein